MRHDPASAAVVVMLRGLKMYGMAQAVGDLIEQGAPAFEASVPMLSQLLKAEMAEREVRSIAYQIKAARFPAYKDLAGFDFAASEINEALVHQLQRGDFMDGADNVVLIGGPGTGKSHIATSFTYFSEPKFLYLAARKYLAKNRDLTIKVAEDAKNEYNTTHPFCTNRYIRTR